MANTHGLIDPVLEQQARWGDRENGAVVAGGLPAMADALTLTISQCRAYVLRRDMPANHLDYLDEASAMAFPLTAGDGTYYVIAHSSSSAVVTDWTRVKGSHYLWRLAASLPALPNRSIMLAHVTVVDDTITTILDARHRILTGRHEEAVSLTTALGTRWEVRRGAMIHPQDEVVLALAAGTIQAGDYQIFDLSAGGTVTFPAGSPVRAAWWGAAPGVDSSAAIQAALHAGPTSMHVGLGAGTFLIGTTVQSPLGEHSDFLLEGEGAYQTVLQRTPEHTGAMLFVGSDPQAVRNWRMRNFGMEGLDRADGAIGLDMLRANFFLVSNVRFFNFGTAIHMSGGSDKNFEELWLDSNNYHIVIDNYGDTGSTVTNIRASWFRQAYIASLTLDGTISAMGLVREVYVNHCIFENGLVTGTNTDKHVVIRDAREVHFVRCHFEDASQHVEMVGMGIPNRYVCDISFDGCHLGQLRDPLNFPLAWSFSGDGNIDGEGTSFKGGMVTTDGTFAFTQRVPFQFQDAVMVSSQTFTGDQWRIIGRRKGSPQFWELPHTLSVARIWEFFKREEVGTPRNSRSIGIFGTDQTSNATPKRVGALATQGESSGRVQFDILAQRTDNAEQAAWSFLVLVETVLVAVDTREIELVSVLELHTPLKSPGATAWTVTIEALGGGIAALCTGAAATEIRWVVHGSALQTGGPELDVEGGGE